MSSTPDVTISLITDWTAYTEKCKAQGPDI